MLNWLKNAFPNMIMSFFQWLLDQLTQFVIKLVNDMLVNPVFMDQLPGFHTLFNWVQLAALLLLSVIFVKEIFVNIIEDASDMGQHPLATLKNTIVSGCLIFFVPIAIFQIIFPLEKYLLGAITGLMGNPKTMSVDLPAVLDISTEQGILAPGFPPFIALLFALGIVICMMIIGFSAGFRWGELFILALAGPILALSKVTYGSGWDLWLKELISVVFSQVVQYLGMILALDIILHPDAIDKINGAQIDPFYKAFIALGMLGFAIAGPKVLRSLVNPGYSNGIKALGALRSAIR